MSLQFPSKIFQYTPKSKKGSNTGTIANHLQRLITDQKRHIDTSDKEFVEKTGMIKEANKLAAPLIEEKSPQTKGIEQYAKDITMKVENDKNKLDELLRKSNRSIMSISSVFPWNFFPNTIDVEESRVTFIFRQLLSSQSHSVDIKDISNVFIESGFFFAKLQIVSRTFIQNDIKIEFLGKKDAYRMKNIIEGLRTFAYHDIDTSTYEIEELVSKLKGLNISKDTN